MDWEFQKKQLEKEEQEAKFKDFGRKIANEERVIKAREKQAEALMRIAQALEEKFFRT